MAAEQLLVLYAGEQMGAVERPARGRLRFRYSPAWIAAGNRVPLSLSMPVLPTEYDTVEDWLWGLMTDNEETLRRVAAQYHVSQRNVFALLTHLGEDVAGAIQLVRPEREAEVRDGGDVRWLTDDELTARVVALNTDAAQARRDTDPGRFSLAGAQAKTALLFQDGRWGIPSGRIPTNRIIKLANGQYDGLIENEHFCLRLARAIGLTAVHSEVIQRGGVTAIVIERYDRAIDGGRLIRLHQEDMCQARGVHPSLRYQNEGGPGVLDVFDVLQASSEPAKDRETFLRMQVFNFLIGGTDAHAKNFSVLLGDGGLVRLAPFYDVASMLPYADIRALKLAMKIGSSYDFANTLPRHWDALGKALRDVPSPRQILEEYAKALPDAAAEAARQCLAEGLKHPVLGRIADSIAGSCQRVIGQLRAEEGVAR